MGKGTSGGMACECRGHGHGHVLYIAAETSSGVVLPLNDAMVLRLGDRGNVWHDMNNRMRIFCPRLAIRANISASSTAMLNRIEMWVGKGGSGRGDRGEWEAVDQKTRFRNTHRLSTPQGQGRRPMAI